MPRGIKGSGTAKKAPLAFTDLRSIDAGIKRLRGIAANTQNLVQDLGVAILIHDSVHNDCSRALDLVKALPNSFRRSMMVNWFAYYGNIGIDMNANKGEGRVRHIPKDAKNYRDVAVKERLDAAKINPWHVDESVPGQSAEVMPYTFGALNNEIIDFTNRLRKRIEGGGTTNRPLQMTDEEKKAALAELDKVDDMVRKAAPPALREQVDQKLQANAA